jgi:hypothetical protein
MHLIWCRCSPLCKILQTVMQRKLRQVEILYVLIVHGLYYVHDVFLFLHISLYLMFSTAVRSGKGALFSQVLVNMSERASVRDLSSSILLLICITSSSDVNCCKTCTQNVYQCTLHGKLACLPLLLSGHQSQHCPLCYLTYYWHSYKYLSTLMCTPVHFSNY